MPKKVGQLSRSAHSQKARDVSAAKMARLRGKEKGATEDGSAFAKAVNVAKRFKGGKNGS